MSNLSFVEPTLWRCACGNELQPEKVEVNYLASMFSVELLRCPKCGLVLVPENLAIGKMLEVEQLLEDK